MLFLFPELIFMGTKGHIWCSRWFIECCLSSLRLCIWYTEPERKNLFPPSYRRPWSLHPSGRGVQLLWLALYPFYPPVLSSWRRTFGPQHLSPRALWPSPLIFHPQTPLGAPAQVLIPVQHHNWYTHTYTLFLITILFKKKKTQPNTGKNNRIDNFF